MSDSYQPIFDAVRSRISNGDIGHAVENAINQANIGHYFEHAMRSFADAGYEQSRPCVIFKPKIARDGDMWGVVLGEDLATGVAGFGESPAKAMEAFDKAWYEKIEPTRTNAAKGEHE